MTVFAVTLGFLEVQQHDVEADIHSVKRGGLGKGEVVNIMERKTRGKTGVVRRALTQLKISQCELLCFCSQVHWAFGHHNKILLLNIFTTLTSSLLMEWKVISAQTCCM